MRRGNADKPKETLQARNIGKRLFFRLNRDYAKSEITPPGIFPVFYNEV